MAYQLTEEDRKLASQLAGQQVSQAFSNKNAPTSKKGGGGLLGLLPLITGTVGTVVGGAAGSVVPGLGTAIGATAGGSGGSGLGEWLRQQIAGEEADLGTMGREALLGAIPGGLGLAAKGVKAAKTGMSGAKALKDAQTVVKDADSLAAAKANIAPQVDWDVPAYVRQGKILGLPQPVPPTTLNLGKGAISSTLSGQRAALVKEATEAQQFNDLARQNIRRLAEERATQGLPLPGGGTLVRPGATPSFASEGIELRNVPSVPRLPGRYQIPFVGNKPPKSATTPPVAPTATTDGYGVSFLEAPRSVPSNAANAVQRSGVIDRIKSGAETARQEGFGLTVGQSKGGGRVLTPDDATRTQDFITTGAQKYGGIRAGKPISQAKDAQNVFNNVVTSLDDTLVSINRPLAAQERTSLTSNILSKVKSDPAITGNTELTEKFIGNIRDTKATSDLTMLEKLRRAADDLSYKYSGDAKTTKEARQALHVRDSIDEFITPLSSEYKAVKGDYTLAKEALSSTSKANKSAKGYTIPLVNVEVGKQSLTGAKNAAASKLAGQGGGAGGGKMGGFRPFVKPAIQQAGTRAASSALFGTPFVGQAVTPEQAQDASLVAPEDAMLSGQAGAETTPTVGKSQQLFDAAIKYLQETGDVKGTQTIQSLAEQAAAMEQAAGGGAQKPLSAEASKVIANANSGLDSLGQLENIIAQEGGVPKGTLTPGRDLFGGAGANILGTASFDTAAKNLTDVITRMRTGAALTESEERFYQAQIPQAFDSPEVIQQKMNLFRNLFQSVANRTGSAGNDMQLMAAG